MPRNYVYKDDSKITESFAYQIFGKRYCELDQAERSEYNRRKREAFRRKKGIPQKEFRPKSQKEPFAHCLSRKLFGCKRTEMTIEQQKEYNRIRCVAYQRRRRGEHRKAQKEGRKEDL